MSLFLQNRTKLTDAVKKIYIVAHNENINNLISSLNSEGFKIEVVKTNYSEKEKKYSRASRCLLNHTNAWKKTIESDELSIIVEADFVPVIGFGNLPLPFDISNKDKSFGYLYIGSARLFWFEEGNYPVGNSSTTVAYVLGPDAAKKFIEFSNKEFKRNNPEDYFAWDTYLTGILSDNGYGIYIPFRCYGEHGGIVNPEHKLNNINGPHQADVLWGKLHFLPFYAEGNYSKFIFYRFRAKIKAVIKLLINRYVTINMLKNNKSNINRLKMIYFSIIRLFSIY